MIMEFKKKKENKDYIYDPLEKCKLIFKPGVTFNNGSLLNRKQSIITIESIQGFIKKESGNISMNFSTTTTNDCIYTVYSDGKFADIIT